VRFVLPAPLAGGRGDPSFLFSASALDAVGGGKRSGPWHRGDGPRPVFPFGNHVIARGSPGEGTELRRALQGPWPRTAPGGAGPSPERVYPLVEPPRRTRGTRLVSRAIARMPRRAPRFRRSPERPMRARPLRHGSVPSRRCEPGSGAQPGFFDGQPAGGGWRARCKNARE